MCVCVCLLMNEWKLVRVVYVRNVNILRKEKEKNTVKAKIIYPQLFFLSIFCPFPST